MKKISKNIDYVYNKYVKEDITIIHLSDIHFNNKTKNTKLIKIYNYIVNNNPDYVVITGDLLDKPSITHDKYKIKELVYFLTNIANKCKLIIEIGNHDIVSDSDFKFFKNLNDLKNIYVLDNDIYKDDKILFGGITLPLNYYYNVNRCENTNVFLEIINNNRKLVDKLPDNIPKVLLVHSPIKIMDNDILNEIYDYDLVLAGHTHGGLIPDSVSKLLKGNYGIIAPDKSFFPSVARGKIVKYYKNKDITLIISSGVTRLSEAASKFISIFNIFYRISINKIIITKERGRK